MDGKVHSEMERLQTVNWYDSYRMTFVLLLLPDDWNEIHWVDASIKLKLLLEVHGNESIFFLLNKYL